MFRFRPQSDAGLAIRASGGDNGSTVPDSSNRRAGPTSPMLLDRLRKPTLSQAARIPALAAFLLVLVTLDHPGLTIDEPLDVRPGRTYLETLAKTGLGFFRADTIDKVFRDNAEHPPLGRWLLGIASKFGETFEVMLAGGPDPIGLYVRSGRLAPAVCFALLVLAIAREAGRRHGIVAAWGAGLGLIAMPRVFSHAHLGALDMFITFFWVVAFLAADRGIDRDALPLRPARDGLLFGLALLTKIHAWLMPPLLLARIPFAKNKGKATAYVLIWGVVGLLVFFVGWPWLWHDTLGRLSRYLGTGVDRTPIKVLYFGTVYEDRAVPWHFPWFHFAATVPVGLHLLGAFGLVRAVRTRSEDAADLRAFAAVLYFLTIFSTNVAVYDGERLYLMVFPLWALLIGRGFAEVWARLGTTAVRRRLIGGFLALQFAGLVSVHPFGLSYYNLAVGGLKGAERLGLELAYWTEAVDAPLLDRLAERAAPNDPAALAPTLAPNQGKILTNLAMLRKPVILDDQEAVPRARWLVLSRREAYLGDLIRRATEAGEIVQVRSRQGVWLSMLVRITKSTESP